MGASSSECTLENNLAMSTKDVQAHSHDPAISLLHIQPKCKHTSPKGFLREKEVHSSVIPTATHNLHVPWQSFMYSYHGIQKSKGKQGPIATWITFVSHRWCEWQQTHSCLPTALRSAGLHPCQINAPARRPTAAQRHTFRPHLLHHPFWAGYQHPPSLKLETGDDPRTLSLSSTRRQTNREVLPTSPASDLSFPAGSLIFFFFISLCCYNVTMWNRNPFSSIYHFLPQKCFAELSVGTLVLLTFKPLF